MGFGRLESPDAAATRRLCRAVAVECHRQRDRRLRGLPNEDAPLFDGDKVLARVGIFGLVERKLRAVARGAPLDFPDVSAPRWRHASKASGGAEAWTTQHDARLLAALCCHGYGKWLVMANDETFDLLDAAVSELDACEAARSTLIDTVEAWRAEEAAAADGTGTRRKGKKQRRRRSLPKKTQKKRKKKTSMHCPMVQMQLTALTMHCSIRNS